MWIYYREITRWLMQFDDPIVQGVRISSFILATDLFDTTLSRSIFWGFMQTDDSFFARLQMGSKSSTVSDITFLLLAVALLFLSPHIQSYIDRSKKHNLIRAEIDTESSV